MSTPDTISGVTSPLGRTTTRLTCCLLFLGVFTAPTLSEDTTPAPRLGLTLAGGGAKGIAHVGVLRWLEEHRIAVDLVTGTSMGALVGGAYASGYSPDEIEAILQGANWDELFAGDIPYAKKSLRRKQDRRLYPARLQLGLKNGVNAASGLESGHLVGLMLSRITLADSDERSFDDLPIPFRCVATDLVAGTAVVFDRGPLGDAMRASMAIPGAFPPSIGKDGRPLVDGYVVDNVPTGVARAMGAQTVIAVGLNRTSPPDVPRSFVAIATRASDILSDAVSRRGLAGADVVLEPDLAGFDVLSWRFVPQLVKRGYDEAESQRDKLLPFALSEADWARRTEQRCARRRAPLATPAFVDVEGIDERSAGVLAARLTLRHADRPLDLRRLGDDLTAIVGTGWIESASFGARHRDGTDGLVVRLRPKSNAPPSLDFGLRLFNESRDIVFSLGARATFVGLAGRGSELRLDAELGSVYGVGAELYRPLGRSPVFVAPFGLYVSRTENIYSDGKLLANVATSEAGGGVSLGVTALSNLEVRSTYRIADFRSHVRSGTPEAPLKGGREEQLVFSIDQTSLDDPFFPTRGVRLTPVARWYIEAPGTNDAFGLARFDGLGVLPFGSSHLSLRLAGEASFGSTPPLLYLPTLGGPGLLGAFGKNEFRGRKTAYAGLTYRRGIGRLPDFVGGPRYLVFGVEVGSAFDQLAAARLEADIHAGLALQTVLGPTQVEVFVGTGGAVRLQVNIGTVHN